MELKMPTKQEICRFCLCIPESTSIDMTFEKEFTLKAEDVFHKIGFQVTPDNDLPVIVCDLCYDFIKKFHVFYEFVKENQEKLLLESKAVKKDEKCVGTNDDFDPKKNSKVKKAQLNLNKTVIKHLKTGGTLDEMIAKQIESTNLYICDHCDKYYAFSPKIAFNHIKKCRNKSKHLLIPSYRKIPSRDELTIACPLCPSHALKLKNAKILTLHLAEHENFDRIDQNRVKSGQSPMFPCPNCERRFSSKSAWEVHVDKHQRDIFMTCELCGRTTVAGNLSGHLQNHFKKFFCEYCSLVCKSQYDLQKHINRIHVAPQYYECAYCSSRIKRKSRLERHLKHCRGPGTLYCPHCSQTGFKTHGERKRHIRQQHLGYRCRICQIQLKNVSSLNRHLKSPEHKEKSMDARLKRAQTKSDKIMKSKSKFLV